VEDSTEADTVLGGTARDTQATTLILMRLMDVLWVVVVVPWAADPARLELVNPQAVTRSLYPDAALQPLPVRC